MQSDWMAHYSVKWTKQRMWNRVQITTRISGRDIRKSRARRCCHLHFFFLLPILTLWCREWSSLSLNLLAKRETRKKFCLNWTVQERAMWPPPDALCSFGNWSQSRHGPTWKCSIVIRTARTQKCAKGTTMTKLRFVQATKKKMFKMFSFLEHDFPLIIIIFNI
jgi:hypothetical protein